MTAPHAESRIEAWRAGAAIAAISAFLAFTNPFQATGELPFVAAFFYWALLVAEGWLGGGWIGARIRRLSPDLPPLAVRALATALVAVLVTATIALVQIAIGAAVPVGFLPTLYGLVLGVSAGIASIAWLVERAFAPGAITHAPAAGAAPRFLERLPAKLKGAVLYAVSAEDHYLRLHTSKGSDLVLMRLSDAIAELDGLEGAQTHRSWWVAREAVESVRRDGDKVVLVLKGGVEAPVSRPNVRPLREAGWF